LESCPAKIFLPNPEARGEHVRGSYLKLGLTRRQIEIVARATPRSQYYYTSPLGSRLFNLDMGPIALALCGSTSHRDMQQARELLTQGVDSFVEAWLVDHGFGDFGPHLASNPLAADHIPSFLDGVVPQEQQS
jgi:type IV secretion system protein VirB4